MKITAKKGNIFNKLEIKFSKPLQTNLEHRLHIYRNIVAGLAEMRT